MSLFACGGSKKGAESPVGVTSGPGAELFESAPVTFEFSSLDDRPVSSAAFYGKPTVLAFVSTGNLGSQAQVNYLVPMAHHDGGAVHYALVAVEPSTQRELVEIYAQVLKVPFPVAMADDASLAGNGPFGDLSLVPTVVILDRKGRIRWRAQGRVVPNKELRELLRHL